jgi:hypothetical protein
VALPEAWTVPLKSLPRLTACRAVPSMILGLLYHGVPTPVLLKLPPAE